MIRLPYGLLHSNVRRTMSNTNLLAITSEDENELVVNPFAANALIEIIHPIVKVINHLQIIAPVERKERKLKTSQINWLFCQVNNLDRALKKMTGKQILLPNPTKKLIRPVIEIERATRVSHPEDYTREGVRLFLKSVNEGDNPHRVSATGRLILNNFIQGIILVRSNVVKYLEKHPNILNIEISKPIIILGLPRTGSTFLQLLLAQDPDSRHLRFWEGNIPLPAPRESTYSADPRIQLAERGLHSAKIIDEQFLPSIRKYHYVSGGGIEEELMILHHCMLIFSHYYLSGNGEFKDWFFREDNKAFAYRYLRRFLQHLSSKYPPRSHWLLKAPLNTLYIDTILQEFPDACVIMTHRHPKYIVPSWSQFQAQMLNIYLEIDQDSSDYWVSETMHLTSEMARRIVAYRKKNTSDRILDISFESLTQDPIGTVENIYKHFGKTLTDKFRENLQEFLKKDEVEGKSTAPKVTLQDVGLTEEMIEEQFAEYLKLYVYNKS